MVKELEDTSHDGVVVVLDCEAAGAVGTPPGSSFDAAGRAAGSVLHAQPPLRPAPTLRPRPPRSRGGAARASRSGTPRSCGAPWRARRRPPPARLARVG